MGKKVRSARGVEVDFDLLKIKMQIAESPAIDVTDRANFVEKRLRRRGKRVATPVAPVKVDLPPLDEPDEFQSEEPELEQQAPDIRPTKRAAK